MGLTKGASDPDRHHHLPEASPGLAGLTQRLRKKRVFPNKQREARRVILGHLKRYNMSSTKPLIHQGIHNPILSLQPTACYVYPAAARFGACPAGHHTEENVGMLWSPRWKPCKNLPPALRWRIHIWMALMRVPTAKEQSRTAVERFSFVVTGEVCGLQMPSLPCFACSGRPGWISWILPESPKNEVVLKEVKAYSLLMCLGIYIQMHLHMYMYTYIYTHSETRCYQKNYKYQMRAEQLELDWRILLYCSDSAQEYLISS